MTSNGRRWLARASCLTLLALTAASPGARAQDSVATLMNLDEQFCRDFTAKGVDGWMSYWADGDIVVFPRRGPFIRTKPEAAEHFKKQLAPRQGLTWKALGGMISASGDLGFTFGTWEQPGATGKYITVWKKQKDGSWKIVSDTGTADAPPPQ